MSERRCPLLCHRHRHRRRSRRVLGLLDQLTLFLFLLFFLCVFIYLFFCSSFHSAPFYALGRSVWGVLPGGRKEGRCGGRLLTKYLLFFFLPVQFLR